jgi:thiamine biosynthesis lipoprotein
MISVTVIAKDAITADAYDNAFMVMGLKRSLEFLTHKKDMEAFFVYTKKDGVISDTATTGFNHYINIKN